MNERVMGAVLDADRLALIQEERRRRGAELAALYPDYFRDMGDPTIEYGLEERLAAIASGVAAQEDENPVRRGVAQLLASSGVPLGAVSDAAELVDLTPVGSVSSVFDVVSSGRQAAGAVGEGRYGDAARAAGSGLLSLADAAAFAAPLVPPVLAGGKAAGRALDAKFQRDFDAFVARHPGLVAPESEIMGSGIGQTYYPGGINDIFMDVPEDIYRFNQARFDEASDLRAAGATPGEILDATGVRFFETRDAAGNLVETRPGLVGWMDQDNFLINEDLLSKRESVPLDELVSDSVIQNVRGKAFEDITVRFDPKMGKNNYGYFTPRGQDSGRPEIVLNANLSDTNIRDTLGHEVEHLLQKQGDLPDEARGTSQDYMYEYVKSRIPELEARLKDKTASESSRTAAQQELDALKSTDTWEMYQRNPGEATARAAEGDPSDMVTYTTPLSLAETINPKLIPNPRQRMKALVQEIASQMYPSEKSVMSLERNVLDKIPGYSDLPTEGAIKSTIRGLNKDNLRPKKSIPMRMEDTRAYDIPVTPEEEFDPWSMVGFSDGGEVS
jgi:hypothetical protein